MSYLVLARKWRPRKFTEIVGQEHVVQALTNALESGRLHHAYLFAGTRGVGKTTIARILAKALNCESGMTAEPCGDCGACRDIDDGRFVDLIEVDAASKTKVDDTRELLDNVQFAPSGGRFKVYLIDEVHMLTKHSFNALLKTLEEPPPHVKFLLATTDPQKLPVTVLSRCLQFNLKRLTPRLIRDRLEYICKAEEVPAEPGALALIARSADGSVRDALSLLDQAIAYCGGEVGEAQTSEMLGTIDRQHVSRLLGLLAESDAAGIMAAIAEIDEQFPDYEQFLDDLARALQQIAVFQVVGQSERAEELSTEEPGTYADAFSAEDLQLYYQIAIAGRRDLSLAPDPRSGFEMTLLRMLAFQPGSGGAGGGQSARPKSAAAASSSATRHSRSSQASPEPEVAVRSSEPASPQSGETESSASIAWEDPDWGSLVPKLGLKGAGLLLASNCSLLEREGATVRLGLDANAESYLTRARQDALQASLSTYFGEKLKLEVVIGESGGETPMQEKSRLEDEVLQAARESLESDPNVKSLMDVFGATLKPDSVRIVDKQ